MIDSFVSAASQLGLLILAISFLYKTFSQRCSFASFLTCLQFFFPSQKFKSDERSGDDRKPDQEPRKEFKLSDDDIVRAAKYVLPVANASIRVTRELFSGEPAMTLKVNR